MVPIVSDAGKSQPHPTGVKVAARLTLTTTKPTLTQEPPILSPKEYIKLKIDQIDNSDFFVIVLVPSSLGRSK